MRKHRIQLLLLSSMLIEMYLLSGCANSLQPVVSPSQAVLLAGQSVQFAANLGSASVSGLTWTVNGIAGGSVTTGKITSGGLYSAPSTLPAQPVTVAAHANIPLSQPSSGVPVQFFNPAKFTSGTVAPTNNPLVAQYSFLAPKGATVQVQFGASTNYGLNTSAQAAPDDGGTVTILVAGMRASSTYHMQAMVSLPTSTQVLDADHTFATGALPDSMIPGITVQQTAGATPAPGVELLNLDLPSGGSQLTALATDLSGNVIWYYDIGAGEWPEPMKLLPNGHILLVAAPLTNLSGDIPPGSGSTNEVREIDLAGNVIYRITLSELNSALTAMGAPFQAGSFHHDILKLPNGHYILLVNYFKTLNNQPGLPPAAPVLGDAIVDWDPQLSFPVWTWSTFDHLNPSRIPYGIASSGIVDWTHSNALVYSPDDGDLLLSMRNQNWIIKINYENGAGDGSILWRFGYQGDFTLPAGQAPIEWNYGQHYASIVSSNSSGVFGMMFFNNGNSRLIDSNNDVCEVGNNTLCYSSVPIFQINEYSKTAQVQWETNLLPVYSVCCGDALMLPNGNIEYDVADNVLTPGLSFVQEVTQEQNPQLVWQMNIQGQLAYRAFRIPSLYPGVEWTQAELAAAESAGRASR